MINTENMNTTEVFAELYNASHPQGLGFLQATAEDMTVDEAQTLLDSGHTYFDYLHGRVMKINLSSNELNTALYDRDNGPGAAARALGVSDE